MEFLIGVIMVQFLYILYQDFVNRRERQKLSLLLKSRDVTEFKTVAETPKEKDSEPGLQSIDEDHVPIENIMEEVPFEKLVEAKDNL